MVALLRRMSALSKRSSNAEVSSILRTFYQTSTSDKRCCIKDNTFGHTFNTIGDVSSALPAADRWAFEFRQFRFLVEETIPTCWFGSRRLTALWTNVFRALHEEGEDNSLITSTASRDIVQFLESYISLDCGQKSRSWAVLDLLRSSAAPDYYGNTFGCPRCPRPISASFLNQPKGSQPHFGTSNQKSQARLSATLDNTLASLFAILASFCLASSHPKPILGEADQSTSFDSSTIISLLGRVSMDVITRVNAPAQLPEDWPFARSTSILCATLLLRMCLQTSADGLGSISIDELVLTLTIMHQEARHETEHHNSLELLPEFVYSTAQSTAKLLGIDGYHILERVTKTLSIETSSTVASLSTTRFLSDLAIASAELFWEKTASQATQQLIQELQTRCSYPREGGVSTTPFHPTPGLTTDREGLQWEDGIGEWVDSEPCGTCFAPKSPIMLLQDGSTSASQIQGHGRKSAPPHDWITPASNDEDSCYSQFSSPQKFQQSTGISTMLPLSSSPIKILDELYCTEGQLSRSLSRRMPLADRTNLHDSRSPQGNKQRETTLASLNVPSHLGKRPNTGSEDDNDEGYEQEVLPRKKTRAQSTSSVSTDEDVDELDDATNHVTARHGTGYPLSARLHHHRPRGTALRSLSTKFRSSHQYRRYKGSTDEISIPSDDDLAI